jgi:hypothetical protein
MMFNDWVIIGASVPGNRHQRLNVHCQDAHTHAILPGGVAVAAAADGLGSAALAEIASSLAVETAVDAVAESLADKLADGGGGYPQSAGGWLSILHGAFGQARARLEEVAAIQSCPLADLGTTLILVVAASGWLAVAHIGDGAVVALDTWGNLETVARPQNGQYINETFPLTLPDALEIAQYQVWQVEIQAVALLSDGLQRLALRLPSYDPHPPFFSPLFQQLSNLSSQEIADRAGQSLADFLASDRVTEHSDDDRTLVLIGRREGFINGSDPEKGTFVEPDSGLPGYGTSSWRREV